MNRSLLGYIITINVGTKQYTTTQSDNHNELKVKVIASSSLYIAIDINFISHLVHHCPADL